MYCQSCQTKLSPRDQNCPTCGRKARPSRDLGSSSPSGSEGKSYPLPPTLSADEDSAGQSQRTPPPPSRKPPASVARAGGDERRSVSRRPVESRRAPEPMPRTSGSGGGFTVRPEEVRRMLVGDPSMIEDGLQVYSEDGDPVGAGYATAVGKIDLLARDSAGAWVVVAVADAERGKEIVGDLLQRMGWVRRHLGKSGQEVRGIVLLDSLPDDLGYAAAAVADSVEFKLYQLELSLESVIV